MKNKLCRTCNTTKPTSDFYLKKAARDGLHRYCIECTKARAIDWQRANPEKMKVKARKWYLANRERKIAKVAEWAKKNPLKRSEQMRNYYLRKKERMKEAACKHRN